MEKKALYNLSYGVFMLSTRSGERRMAALQIPVCRWQMIRSELLFLYWTVIIPVSWLKRVVFLHWVYWTSSVPLRQSVTSVFSLEEMWTNLINCLCRRTIIMSRTWVGMHVLWSAVKLCNSVIWGHIPCLLRKWRMLRCWMTMLHSLMQIIRIV